MDRREGMEALPRAWGREDRCLAASLIIACFWKGQAWSQHGDTAVCVEPWAQPCRKLRPKGRLKA